MSERSPGILKKPWASLRHFPENPREPSGIPPSNRHKRAFGLQRPSTTTCEVADAAPPVAAAGLPGW
eukprot:8036029-Pyramimonas_sp.AAC.1